MDTTTGSLDHSSISIIQRSAVRDVCRKIAEMHRRKMNKTKIGDEMSRVSFTVADINLVMIKIDEVDKFKESGIGISIVGITSIIVGIVFYNASYAPTKPMQTYTIFYQVIIFGGMLALFGVFRFLIAPRGVAKLTSLIEEHVLQSLALDDLPRWEEAAKKLRSE